jgi:hypothetical protein
MFLTRNIKVPLWNRNCLYAILVLTSTFLIGHAVCSDSNSNFNSEAHANNQRKLPSSGSGSGILEKRSSYAVISQAMSDTINNEFGSKYRGGDHLRGFIFFALRGDHLSAETCHSFIFVLKERAEWHLNNRWWKCWRSENPLSRH